MIDLGLKITVDGAAQAKQALQSVEQGVQRVETASDRTSPALANVTKSFSEQYGAANNSAQAMADYVINSSKAEAAALRQADAFVTGTVATQGFTGGLGALTAAGGASTVMLGGLAAGAILAASALGAIIGILGDSARYYFENAKEMKGARAELALLNDEWDAFRFVTGAALISGAEPLIVSALRLVETALVTVGVKLAGDILLARELFALAGGGGIAALIMGADPGPRLPSAQQMEGQLLGRLSSRAFLRAAANPGYLEPPSMDAALRMNIPLTVAKPPRAPSGYSIPGLPYHIGMSGGLPGGVDLAAAGMQYGGIPGLPYHIGLSSLPGTPVNMAGWLQPSPQGFWSQAFGGAGGFGSGLGSTILSAFTGGGDAGKSIGGFLGGGLGSALGPMLSKSIGGSLGKVFGSVLPGIGTMLGGLGGDLLGGLFGKLFGETQGHKELMAANGEIKKLQDNLIATYGPLDQLEKKANILGISFKATWGDQNVKGLEHFKGVIQDFEQDQERLNKAVEKYGFTWEELGPKLQNAKITDFASDLTKDMEVLLRAGVDSAAVFTRMSGDFSKLVQMSISAGIEIPGSLQGVLQKLIDMGLLVDANGEKLQDLSGVHFSASTTAIVGGLDRVVQKLDELLIGLGIKLPEAAQRGADGVNAAMDGIHIPSGSGGGGNGDGGGGGREAHIGGYISGFGIQHFHRGGEVLARLLPGEFVLQRSAVDRIGLQNARRLNSGGSLGGGLVVNVTFAQPVMANDHTSLATMADFVAKTVESELRRQGVRLAS